MPKKSHTHTHTWQKKQNHSKIPVQFRVSVRECHREIYEGHLIMNFNILIQLLLSHIGSTIPNGFKYCSVIFQFEKYVGAPIYVYQRSYVIHTYVLNSRHVVCIFLLPDILWNFIKRDAGPYLSWPSKLNRAQIWLMKNLIKFNAAVYSILSKIFWD